MFDEAMTALQEFVLENFLPDARGIETIAEQITMFSQNAGRLTAIGLAFFFGYLLTFVGVRRSGLDVRSAVRTALAADTVSILVMEIVDNAVLVTVPGAMHAGLLDALFWGSLVFALAVAFVVTVPVNKWVMGRGKGHAVVHQMHDSHH